METYHGHVRTPTDAIILFEACRIGQLPRVQRRLSEKERQQIKSGSVFVWDEREAGMRRWTDGKSWSASRVSGSFLTYREMEGKRGGNGYPANQAVKKAPEKASAKPGDSDEDGPDGYRYKPDGLMKQSFSITTSTGQHLHLISYYSRSHPSSENLMQPSQDPALRHIRPAKGMYPESTVNESSSGPVITRGPMPGSPFAPSPHQMPLGSPYGGATHAYAVQYPMHSYPPTPIGTPPYSYQPYFPPAQMAGHSPIQYPVYAPPAPYRPAPASTYLDRPAPALTNSALPPPPPSQPLSNGHLGTPMHYLTNVSPRAAAAAQLAQQQTPPLQPSPHGPHAQVDPRLSMPPGVEQAQLPLPQPIANGVAANGERRSPAPSSQPTSDPYNTPKTNGVNGAASVTSNPSVIPSISALMNGSTSEPDARSDKSASRAGSRSPGSSQRLAQDIPGEKIGLAGEDKRAVGLLDKNFAS